MHQFFTLLTILLFLNWPQIQAKKVLEMGDCLEFSENLVCYHCDTNTDPYCGNPFQFSHYYDRPKEVTMVECQGCCVKIVHPEKNGTRRIQRSCTDNLSNLNFSLEINCDSYGENRGICICQQGLCNNARVGFQRKAFSLAVVITFVVHCFIWK